MRPIETSTRILAAALLAAFAVAGCGGGEPADAGSGDTGIMPASGEVGEEATAGTAPATEDAPATEAGAPPPPGTVIQSQTVDASPFVAELIEAEREDGVLTIKVRIRNAGSESAYHSFETEHGRYEKFYVTAGDQKYFVLKDTEGAPLAPKYLNPNLEPGMAMTWWAKFPAPPASVTEIDFIMPDVTPFEDVPITEG